MRSTIEPSNRPVTRHVIASARSERRGLAIMMALTVLLVLTVRTADLLGDARRHVAASRQSLRQLQAELLARSIAVSDTPPPREAIPLTIGREEAEGRVEDGVLILVAADRDGEAAMPQRVLARLGLPAATTDASDDKPGDRPARTTDPGTDDPQETAR